MRMFMIILVSVTLIERICQSEIKTKLQEFDGFNELEDAVIHLLTTCYKNKGKTIRLFGEFPDSFIRKLSPHEAFSIVRLDNRKKISNENSLKEAHLCGIQKYKLPIFVTIASNRKAIVEMLKILPFTAHQNSMASVLVIGWSATTKCLACKPEGDLVDVLVTLGLNDMPNANVITRVNQKFNVIITASVYSCKTAPQPWQVMGTATGEAIPNCRWYYRVYSIRKNLCENLEFDKTYDLCGLVIEVLLVVRGGRPGDQPRYSRRLPHSRQPSEVAHREFGFIERFMKYMNATLISKAVPVYAGLRDIGLVEYRGMVASYQLWRNVYSDGCTYPEQRSCAFLITQFRGNKSQLRKIYDVIDGYSWIGMLIVYLITFCFFKWFLRQPVLIRLLNLVRLTGNWGLPVVPSNPAPRIYIACLLFFVVTMQGIFMGDLASLLTHDIPVRQVDSVQDLIDLGYSLRVHEGIVVYFNDPLLKNRLRMKRDYEDCIDYVRRDPSMACASTDDVLKRTALKYNLHVSPGCIAIDYVCLGFQHGWAYEERINSFLGRMASAGTRMPFESMVYRERMMEYASIEIPLEPRVMVFAHLRFAFNILAVGLLCASVTFVAELIVDRYQRGKTTTRVIMLN